MHLMYYLDDAGKRVYTLKVPCTLPPCCHKRRHAMLLTPVLCLEQKAAPDGSATVSAHPGAASRATNPPARCLFASTAATAAPV